MELAYPPDDDIPEIMELSYPPEPAHVTVQAAVPSDGSPGRVWNSADGEDLNKLGNMIFSFIAVPQFAGNPTMMKTHVKEPLMDRNGPRARSIEVLKNVMGMIMIRHRFVVTLFPR